MEQLLNKIPVSPSLQSLIGLAFILATTALVALLARTLSLTIMSRLTSKTGTDLDDRLLNAIRKPTSLLIYVFGLSVAFDFVKTRYPAYLSESFSRVIDGIIYGIGVVIVAILIIKVTSAILGWYGDTVAARTETTLDDEFVPLLDRTTRIVIVTLAALIVLDHFGVDIKGLVAVLGVGSLAVALAAQETLANMIGGFTIMIDRPFRVNDMVALSDERRVTVHEIGIRSTKFLTFDNTLVIVPNSELVKSTVHNITYPRPMVRVVVDVGVGYDSDIELVRRVMLDEAAQHPKVLTQPKPEFFFESFGDSSLDVSLRCHVARAEDHRPVASELRLQVLTRFRAEGIQIPFPQRVVTMLSDHSGTDEAKP